MSLAHGLSSSSQIVCEDPDFLIITTLGNENILSMKLHFFVNAECASSMLAEYDLAKASAFCEVWLSSLLNSCQPSVSDIDQNSPMRRIEHTRNVCVIPGCSIWLSRSRAS